jgi:NADPH2:quinone reductase
VRKRAPRRLIFIPGNTGASCRLTDGVRAIGVTEFGGPEVLHFVDLPDPAAGPGEVRIRVHAAVVNPTDTGLRSGARADMLRDVSPPYVPGMDVAGVLDQLGPGTATDLRAGEHVMAIVAPRGSHGGYSELVVVPAESVVRVPAGASDAEAATLPMNGLTTVQALDLLGLEPGQTLAVTGAAGAVGGYAVQLGRAAGLRVIADASGQDEQLVKDLGADLVVRRGAEFADRVREAVPGGADGLIDAALLNELAVPAVRDGGRIATVRGFRGDTIRGITFHPVTVRSYAREHAKLDRLRRQAEAGQVTLRVARVLPAGRAAEAHRILEAGGTRGRLVLGF